MSIYLGGTGSANELHDYEEGTWTPTFPNGGSRNVLYATYVKVGRIVYVNFELSATQPSPNNSQFQIGGLPFTVHGTGHGFGNLGYVGASSMSAVNLMPLAVTNGSYIYFHRQDGTSNPWTNNQYRSTSYNQKLYNGSRVRNRFIIMALTQINKAGLDEIALDHVFTIGASGSSAYTFQGEGLNGTVNNPTLYLTRGKTYRFENGSGGHPIRIQSTSGASGTAYNTGVTNNAGSGTVIVEVQHNAPDVLYYQCTSHAAMNGILYITGALADGGVTTAKIADANVTTAKIADSAVTSAKIADGTITAADLANDCVGSAELQNSAVHTANILDQAVTLAKLPHGTSSNDGKFLRANNGADPSFETVSIPAGTTINNNANNRVITGSGTANTLEGESALTFDGSTLDINGGSTDTPLLLDTSNSSGSHLRFRKDGANKHFLGCGGGFGLGDVDDLSLRTTDNIIFGVGTSERMRLTSNGKFGLNRSSPQYAMHLSPASGETRIDVHMTNSTTGHNNNDGVQFGYQNSAGAYIWNFENTDIYFGTNGTKRASFLAAGGLAFNNDTAQANALDDYEEGSWTPNDASGGGVTISSNGTGGTYTKIGRLVHVQYNITYGSTSNNNSAAIGGLPFSQNVQYGTGAVGWTSRDNPAGIMGHIGSATQIYFMDNTSASSNGGKHLQNQELSGVQIIGNATYYAAT